MNSTPGASAGADPVHSIGTWSAHGIFSLIVIRSSPRGLMHRMLCCHARPDDFLAKM
jgi:hypothetical protein